MKKFNSLLLIITLFMGVFILVGCEKKEGNKSTSNSNLLKDNREEAEKEISTAMEAKIKEVYGDKIEDYRIYIEKVYSSKDEEEDETVKNLKLSDDEVLFYVNYELKPSKGIDPNELTIPDGRIDEDTGWVVDLGRFGTLTPSNDGVAKFTIKNFGTGL